MGGEKTGWRLGGVWIKREKREMEEEERENEENKRRWGEGGMEEKKERRGGRPNDIFGSGGNLAWRVSGVLALPSGWRVGRS